MPTIASGTSFVTHINVFSVDPKRQQELVESLTETVNAARHMEGWLSASIHRSFDGRSVVNYIQFESQQAGRRVTQQLLAMGLIQKNTAIGAVQPGQYEVVYTAASE